MESIDMADESFNPQNLQPGRMLRLFALLSSLFVIVLAVAPLRPYFAEWRSVQKRYNTLATQTGAATIPIAIQQIWKPQLGVTDRCVTCHLGMGQAAPLESERLFRAHPPVAHDPKEFGCTVCHGGQGRATTKEAAHGFVSFWDEQMLPVEHLSAGCGTCHTEAPLVSRRQLERGRLLVESLDCLSCHRMDGRGRGSASDLSYVGLKGYRADWHPWHLAEQAKDRSGLWASRYGEIAPEDVATINAYLNTRIGAARIVEAQAVAMERGCLGCHKIGGRGGDEGPALDAVGRKPVGDLNFERVPGERTFVNYMRHHLRDPVGIVPGSQMPAQALSDREIELLTSYILFLRGRELPAAYMPKERVRRDVLKEKPAPMSGEQVFSAYCSACHGSNGEGKNYGSLDVRFPAIGQADFLDVATDTFIESTLKTGRPGRKMPALGAAGGSLTQEEISSLIQYLRARQPQPPSLAAVEQAASNRSIGEQTYKNDCAACHGRAGEGTPLGSPLATADSRIRGRRAEAYRALTQGVANTAMPQYTGYDAVTLRSLLDYVTALPIVAGSRASWRIGSGDAASGKMLYLKNCAGCHGEGGAGKLGPALANAGFLKAATREYIAATIVRGRAGTPMPAFGRDSVNYSTLAPNEVLDITAFVREQLGR
ncbi:MAG: c-type cytochrome [Acidobacteriota bacterium]|nr:c-type cytochrome [Blastocatellia bacterium]MDW8240924.1 c-type cytochrome [Acidobacteriota bacterium]